MYRVDWKANHNLDEVVPSPHHRHVCVFLHYQRLIINHQPQQTGENKLKQTIKKNKVSIAHNVSFWAQKLC
jgi:hypothetical protein